MEILIKGMVCHHCVGAVKRIMDSIGIQYVEVALGKVTMADEIDTNTLRDLDLMLEKEGFSRIMDADSQMVENIKHAVIEHVRKPDECRLNLSACLEQKLGMPYDTMSRIFSAHETRTIEKYQMLQRVEWVKELLGYGIYSIGEIAFRTGYSSTAHLSRQFKNITGFTPTEYLRGPMKRKGLNEV